MVIYAFYGMGKSTFTHSNADICLDIDEQYYYDISIMEKIIKENKNDKIVFINSLDSKLIKYVDLAFVPNDIMVSINRLKRRNVDNSFINNLIHYKDEIYDIINSNFSNLKIITLKDNEYISNYKDLILNSYFGS